MSKLRLVASHSHLFEDECPDRFEFLSLAGYSSRGSQRVWRNVSKEISAFA